ncbi:hypothetical protein M2163_006359 [Streptomyces sp. SAI-135]|nr:hypothetical protein [Streptomyces sp. SAI-135]
MGRFVRWAAVTAAAALLVAGCSGGSSGGDEGEERSGSARPTATGAKALPASLTSQRPDWEGCKATADASAPGRDWQCATLKVPLDWSRPGGKTIDLALIRSLARGGDRIGSLLFNFGGPGASGIAGLPGYAATVSLLRERYDLVSWDPRGVGASEGVRCRGDKETQAAEAVDATPDTPAEERAFLKDAADFARGCQRDAGDLLAPRLDHRHRARHGPHAARPR